MVNTVREDMMPIRLRKVSNIPYLRSAVSGGLLYKYKDASGYFLRKSESGSRLFARQSSPFLRKVSIAYDR